MIIEAGEDVACQRNQPAGPAIERYRRILDWRTGNHGAIECVLVQGIEAANDQRCGTGQASAIDQAARELVVLRQAQRRIPERPARFAFWRNEVGGARRVQQVFVRGVFTLLSVGVEQGIRRLAVDNQLEFPCKVLGILHAAVGAAGPEWRYAVRRVAGKEDAAMPEFLHAQAGEGIDADPFQFEFRILAQERLDARDDFFRLPFSDRIGIPAKLEIDTPYIVGLAVQQNRLVRMKGRIEPEPPFGWKRGFHLDVRNQEPVTEGLALAFQSAEIAHRTARAVGGDQVIALQPVFAIGRIDAELDTVIVLRKSGDLVFPAHVDKLQVSGAVEQVAFHVILLEIDECRPAVSRFRQQIELVHHLLAKENFPHVPGNAFGYRTFTATQPVHDLQRALGKADGARAGGQGAVVVQKNHRYVLLREIDRRRKADRPCAYDHDRPAYRYSAVLVGRAPVGIHRTLIILVHCDTSS